jgi:hypothetical protein
LHLDPEKAAQQLDERVRELTGLLRTVPSGIAVKPLGRAVSRACACRRCCCSPNMMRSQCVTLPNLIRLRDKFFRNDFAFDRTQMHQLSARE